MENYTFRIVDGKTELALDMDSTKKYIDYIQKTWSKALEKVRELAKKSQGIYLAGKIIEFSIGYFRTASTSCRYILLIGS